MTSSAVDLVLLAALVATCGLVLVNQRRLKRLASSEAEHRRLLSEMTRAIDAGRIAIATLANDGRTVAFTLAARIEQAKSVLAELENQTPATADRTSMPSVIPFVPNRAEPRR